MCGRYYFNGSIDPLQDILPLTSIEDPGLPRYNIAPSQRAPVIRAGAEGHGLVQLQWGLVPHWANDRQAIKPQINARAESAHEKPFFRAAFRSSRCLVPANGFFEWQRQGDRKQPYCISLTHDEPFYFAGLWANNRHGVPLETFTILTCAPNGLMQSLHHRMPVILHPQHYEAWLSGSPAQVKELLRPYPESDMKAYAVSSQVNNPRNDDPTILQRL